MEINREIYVAMIVYTHLLFVKMFISVGIVIWCLKIDNVSFFFLKGADLGICLVYVTNNYIGGL